jgi:hypothetical protein
MKFELTAEYKKQLKHQLESSNIRKWFQNRDNMKFNVGDVIVKYFLRTDYKTSKQSWVMENINSDNKMAQRYVYIYEDEFGIGYIKPLRVSDGTLGKDIFCMIDFDYTCTKFEVDPEHAERVLLDADFDIRDINKKIGQKPKSLQEINDIFDKVNVGDTIWITYDYTGRHFEEYTITAIKKVTLKDLEGGYNYTWKRWKEKNKDKVNSTYCYNVSYKGTWQRDDRSITEWLDYVIYTKQKPALPEDKK